MSVCESRLQASQVRSIDLPSGKLAPSQAGQWLGWLAAFLEPDRLADARLMLSELVSNAVMHADLREGDPIHVTARVGPNRVQVSVCDRGRGFEPVDPPRRPPANTRGGLGLWVVDTLADGLRINGSKGSVCFEVAREG